MKYFFVAILLLFFCKGLAQETVSSAPVTQADHLIKEYKYGEALLVLNAVSDSIDAEVLLRAAFCHARLGNVENAIVAYERIRGMDSVNRESLYNLGQLYSQSERYDLSRECFQKLIQLDSGNSFYYRQYAALAVKANDPIGAIAYYHRTIQLNPRDMESYGQLSSILIDAQQYPYVDSMLTKVLSTAESNRLRLLLARAKFGQDKYEEVIENVNAILQTNDTTATYARLMGISNFMLDRYDEVISWMQFLIKSGAKAGWIYYYLGVAYQKQGEPERAIEYLNMAIDESISDHIGTYYTQLASVYEEVKDYKNAIRNYKVAYETSKADILLYHLARNYDVYYKDKLQARLYYQKYLESDDTIKVARAYSAYRLDALSVSR